MELMIKDPKKNVFQRRKFFLALGALALGIGWLKNFWKSRSGSKKYLPGSIHPARFYRKLFSKPTGGE